MRKIAFILETRTDEYGYNIRGELISAAKNAEGTKVIEYQYTQISNLCDSASLREEFLPQFDDDGNQTLVKTATGIWQVTYNGENRCVLYTTVVFCRCNYMDDMYLVR